MGIRDLRRIFKGIVINPVAPDRVDYYDPGYLVIEGERIARLTLDDPQSEFPGAEFRDMNEKIILPGFVDTHVHLPQFAIMGVGKGQLLTWLNTYTYPEETRFADPQYAEKISTAFFDELIANGTTTAVIYCSIHEHATDIAFTAARAKGVRAFIGKTMMDRNSPSELQEDSQDSIEASMRLFERWDNSDGGRLRYIFTPRYAASCSMSLMKRVGEIARRELSCSRTWPRTSMRSNGSMNCFPARRHMPPSTTTPVCWARALLWRIASIYPPKK